ncbi:hypothetical protein B0T10DRAFT_462572 [Thelonectria olida]|uniref:Uncharacterized protein n=1 Tax=Thelonectria olida TaxID=1576542 RepID=A0A9P8VYP5_9HYPO|nr:hypothetical protein B0T10DRAFT_462572 [Thelonectria olida]
MSTYPDTSNSGNASTSLSPNFGMHWLEEPPFEVDATAVFIDKFFNYSSSFWKDDGTEPYRVFIRHDNVGTGGTALKSPLYLVGTTPAALLNTNSNCYSPMKSRTTGLVSTERAPLPLDMPRGQQSTIS